MRTFLLITCYLVSIATFAQATCEQPGTRLAKDVLPDRYQGALYRIRSPIESNGYLNTYVIQTDYGDFIASGESLLNTRLREIDALHQLDSISKTRVFAEAAVDAGLSPVYTVIDFTKRPVATIIGIPRGIGNFFKRNVRKGQEGIQTVQKGVTKTRDFVGGNTDKDESTSLDEQNTTEKVREESIRFTERYFKVSRAERAWHAELGTDPYTSNEMLAAAIKKVAWADRLGRFGLKLTGGISITGADIIADTTDLVWGKDPYALEDYNRGVLEATGADEQLIEAFFDESNLSPTMQTTLINALDSLSTVTGRQVVLQESMAIGREQDALVFLESILNLIWIHRNLKPLKSFLAGSPLTSATDNEGNVHAAIPSDHLYWTCDLEAVLSAYNEVAGDASLKTMYISGKISQMAKHNLTALGWQVETDARARFIEIEKAKRKMQWF